MGRTAPAVSVQGRVRAQVARWVWRTNPASVALGAAAIVAAERVDAGDVAARPVLRSALRFLRDCEAVADGLDEVRAQAVRRGLEALAGRGGADVAG